MIKPRKLKKRLIGKRIGKSKLKALIKSVKIIPPEEPGMSALIEPFTFCPKCGCTKELFVDHHVEYPEVWYECFCHRCLSFVSGADNSVHQHVLEYDDFEVAL